MLFMTDIENSFIDRLLCLMLSQSRLLAVVPVNNEESLALSINLSWQSN